MDQLSDPPHGAEANAIPIKGRKAAVGFIFASLVMDVVAFGLVLPVLPQLIRQFVGGDVAAAARYAAWFGFIFGLTQFVCSPILGALSDRFGRRPVLLMSVFGLGFDYMLMAAAPSLAWLFLGRLISGATAASFSTASAYIADVTPPEQRAKSFGVVGVAFGVGFAVGPAIGGLLSGPWVGRLLGGHSDLRLPFWFAASLALINGLYGLFVLPESLPKSRRAEFSLAKASPAGSFRLLRSHPQLSGIAIVVALYFLAQQVLQSTVALYATQRFNWAQQPMGFFMLGVGVGSIVVQAFIVGPFVTRFGDRRAVFTGLAFGAAGYFIYAVANTPWLFVCGVPVFALTGLVQPGCQSLMTRWVSSSEQGRLQGANAGLVAMSGIVGPLLFGNVFAWSIHAKGFVLGQGTVMYLATAMMILALTVAWRVTAPAQAVGPAP